MDSLFANNKDLSSQLGYLLILVNETTNNNKAFDIYRNLINYRSIKSKHVTCSVLASEIYRIVLGVDIVYIISSIIIIIID